jgi:flagellum-specific peptidoglycan hydrolase FlgJ
MMEMRDQERAKAQAAIAKFNIKFITGPNKTTIGYEIDGKRYNKFEDLPAEFQNIINAYGTTDLRSYSSRVAIADIAENPNKYKVLETREGRAQVLEPPAVADIENRIIRAAMAAKLTATEPQLTTPNVDFTTPRTGMGNPSAVADSATSVSSPGKFTNNDQFVQVMLPLAKSAAEQLGNPALTLGILGQWAGETGAGRRISADFNYAGIKAGNKYAKGSYVLTEERYTAAQLERAKKSGETLERVLGPNDKITKDGKQYTVNQFYGGGKDVWQEAKDQGLQWVQVRTHFAKFNSLEDFVSAYVSVLKNKNYASAIQATDPKQFGLLVARAGYATADPTKYSKKVEGMVASLGLAGRDSYGAARTSIPLIVGTPGAAVASPPAPVAVAAATEEPNKAEVAGQAALVANKIVQKNVVALAGKVATLDKESKLDRQFPSVRNSEFGVA